MKLTDAQIRALIARGDLIEQNGRWYVAYDVAAPAIVAASSPYDTESIEVPTCPLPTS